MIESVSTRPAERGRHRSGWGACLLPFLLSCADPGGPPDSDLAEVSYLRGQAAGSSGNLSAECKMELAVTLTSTGRSEGEGVTTYRAEWGGSIYRQVVDPEGDGFGFWLHLHDSDALLRMIGPDSIEIDLDNADVPDHRFYQALEVVGGRFLGDRRAAGAWTCAPLDIWEHGYVDTTVVARGAWSLFPEGENP